MAAAVYVTLASTIATALDSLTMTAYQFLAGTTISESVNAWQGLGTVLIICGLILFTLTERNSTATTTGPPATDRDHTQHLQIVNNPSDLHAR